MSHLDFPPRPFEIKDQLKCILASQRFQNAQNPSDFLALVVKRALKGKKTPGHVIAQTLFKDKYEKLVSNDVRVTASNLRKTLKAYYQREGRNDVVIISFPEAPEDKKIRPVEGLAYTPVFSFNPSLLSWTQLTLGFRLLEHTTFDDYVKAYWIFSAVLGDDPQSLGGRLGMVETLCRFADRNWKNPENLDPVAICNFLISSLESEAAGYWRYWATRAYAAMVLGSNHDDLAAPGFERALALDQVRTEGYVPYINFLFEAKRMDEALGLANRYYKQNLQDPAARNQFAMFLVKAGSLDSAYEHLQFSLQFDPLNIGTLEMLAFMEFVNGDLERAFTHIQKLKSICEPTTFAMIAKDFEKYEEQHAFKGWTAKRLLADTSASSAKIAKR